MKNDNLGSLSIIPEEFEKGHLNNIDFSTILSKMGKEERYFINGLIRYYKPTNLLEIGVFHGGGSVVLLNAINDMPKSRLVSIDIENDLWDNNNKFKLAGM